LVPLWVLTTKKLVALKGGLSALAAHVLKLFYSKDGWKFETVGVRVPCTCGQPYLVRAQFAAILADEKAIKEVWSLKGSSGTKPCVCCKNVVGRMDVEVGGYLVHYRWARPEHFDLHTDSSFREMVEQLKGPRSRKDLATLFWHQP
jgi:hypothetical protein